MQFVAELLRQNIFGCVCTCFGILICFSFHDFYQENESFQEALRSAQRRLIIATQDRSFLLDRLLLYERVENSSSESEETDSSDDPEMGRVDFKR